MAGVNYDSWEGTRRLAEAAGRIDKRAPEIFAYHAAMEMEIDVVLTSLLPRADKLSRLGFPHKVSVLNAAWAGAPEAADKLCHALVRFNDLRNAIAHFNQREVEACLKKLRTAYAEIEPRGAATAAVGEIAVGLCAFMGDTPNPADLQAISDAMGKFVNRWTEIAAALKFEMPKIDVPEMPKIATPKMPKFDVG
ncbi:hypothetical protein U0030_02245 [Brevundimonas bullata]|uniref:hypothetical protein n=1 Tax=Brevundimonas bullata TaxID=13160 RepID=UPI000E0C973F|nr:hypothetical protein [Brevundimonas bullata]WQE37322.1 hypothetical protein U0030_02245 [Brevundimonas bullata]